MNNKQTLPDEGMTPEPRELLVRAEKTLSAASELIHRRYLANLQDYPVLPPEEADMLHNADIALFRVERLVTENRQAVLESVAAVYTALGAAGYAVFFVLESDGHATQFYIGTRGQPRHMLGRTAGELLKKSFDGHFPGSLLSPLKNGDDVRKTLDFDSAQENLAVTAVIGIPALSTDEREHFTQGLERFLDAADGEAYRALLLAEPLPSTDLHNIQAAYEATASQLSPLQKQQLSYGVNESASIAQSLAESLSTTLGETIGHTATTGTNRSVSTSEGNNESTTKDPSMLLGSIAAGAGFLAFGPPGAIVAGAVAKGVSSAFLGSQSKGTSTTHTETEGESTSSSESSSQTSSSGRTESHTDTNTSTSGSNRQLTLESLNKPVEQLLTKIDHHLERIDEARAYGGWQTAAYFIANDTATSKALGSMFLGLMRGNRSNAEDFALTTWNRTLKEERKRILGWLSTLTHPRFKPDFIDHLAVDHLTSSALLSGRELAIQLGLPRQSTSAVTVLEVPSYGRSVNVLNSTTQADADEDRVMLGYLRHLWRNTTESLHLALDQLCSHTLITGTTGVGKTTAIMSLLAQTHRMGVPFMVIEPAKGEYRRLLGLSEPERPVSYRVAGRTGPDSLRINPMIFPDGIELSDHVDRVCTIFSAAFPMYAAMPQVFEEAIFTAYENMGWDIITSRCIGPQRRFPTLRQVADLIPDVVQNLGYSEQLSSDYIGALGTRLRSLCRGSLGLTLLCSQHEETSDQILFESSTVIDLSPMGSPEKRALIMGILFMRMYEKRLAEGLPDVTSLRHLMVLEEAHVLLKRTSTDQNQESSNPRGLAVESFANALAEMRAFGQGFVVADQSASALDDAVLRNTNTKIVMRAPFEADRIALGGALALNDEQTRQLAKLENHTAVIYQSNWLEPVLCGVQQVDIPACQPGPHRESSLAKKVAKGMIMSALWQGRLNGMTSDRSGEPDEQAVENALTALNLTGYRAKELKRLLAKRNYIDLNTLKTYLPLLFPQLADGAFTEMTVSTQALFNHIYAMLEHEVDHIPQKLRDAMLDDIVKAFAPDSAHHIHLSLKNIENTR